MFEQSELEGALLSALELQFRQTAIGAANKRLHQATELLLGGAYRSIMTGRAHNAEIEALFNLINNPQRQPLTDEQRELYIADGFTLVRPATDADGRFIIETCNELTNWHPFMAFRFYSATSRDEKLNRLLSDERFVLDL